MFSSFNYLIMRFLRFNRDEPCKAVKTLESVLLNWTKEKGKIFRFLNIYGQINLYYIEKFFNKNRFEAYSLNCNNQAAAARWLKRVEGAAERTSEKLTKNVENCA